METSDLTIRPNLEQLLDVGKLEQYVEDGIISKKCHPTYYKLFIYNYTAKAVTVDDWDDTLSLCRGLIVNGASGEVIARPFRKFWNFNDPRHPETLEANLPKSFPQVMEKMDGSLGILYEFRGESAIATRGSFTSEQAEWATKWYRNHIRNYPTIWPEGWTPLFEIIYPENRIVCSYDFEGLVLIGMVSNFTGEEMPYQQLKFWAQQNGFRVPCLSIMTGSMSVTDLGGTSSGNKEGYVLTWFDPYVKVKVKFEDYVRLHRIITGLNVRTVWEMMSSGSEEDHDRVQRMLGDKTLPDDFRHWLHEVVFGLLNQQIAIEKEAREAIRSCPDDVFMFGSRKDVVLHILKRTYTNMGVVHVAFAMLDGKDYAPIIWKMLKPKGTQTFKVDGE